MIKQYKNNKEKRKIRVRGRVRSVSTRPRLTVFRSNKHIFAQVIDDKQGKTVASVSDIKLTVSGKMTKTEKAEQVGTELAKLALKAKVKQVYFDRGEYKFHGRIKALAEAARKNGLEF